MIKQSKKHCIYAFEFEELGVAYVGLTKQLKTRKSTHLNPNQKGNRRLKALFAAGERYVFRVLQEGIAREEAAGREEHWYDCYKINGYEMLNVARLGALGSPEDGVYWIQEKCKEDAALYKTKSDWQRANGSAYNSARKNGWLIECCAHMDDYRWTLESCKVDALLYETKTDWGNASGAYAAAFRYGWLEECCAHMRDARLDKNKWPFDACLTDALQYDTLRDWLNASPGAVNAAKQNGWIKECCAHMIHGSIKWTLEACKADALKHETKKKWIVSTGGGYGAALRNGWIKECCAHMIDGHLARIKWTRETCKADALEYETRGDWNKSPKTGYEAARKNGWLEECCRHMDIHKQITSKDSDAISVRPQTKAA